MYGFSLVWLLVLIFIRVQFEYIKVCGAMTVNNLKMVIWALKTVGEDSVQYRKRKSKKTKKKKTLLLSSSYFVFIGKLFYNLRASLSCSEALFLDVTLYALNNCSLWNKESEI